MFLLQIIPYLRSSNEFLDQLFLSLDSSSVADLIIQLSQQETKQQHIIFEVSIEVFYSVHIVLIV